MTPTFLVIDLFCGAGGTTTGFAMAGGVAKVIACVNHDPKAIESHWKNHPEVVHFEEDIRTLKLHPLRDIVRMYRAQYPDAYLVLWASLECTNFSKAKGGQPRDADSRTLADHLDRYITALKPDYIKIENVVEFMAWGPLDANGKPVSRKNGADWMKWRQRLCEYGYRDEWRELNAADFGAYTSRNRLFGIFARPGLPVAWPAPTHARRPTVGGMFGTMEKWKPVKEVLDFSDEGESIFGRRKPLVEKTLERIYAGLIKYVAGGKDAFLLKYNSTNQATGQHTPPSIDQPCPTVAAQSRLGVVKASFIQKHFSGRPEGKVIGVDEPAGTITTSANQSLVQAQFLQTYYGNGFTTSTDSPCPTITTKDRSTLVTAKQWLMDTHYANVGQSLDAPLATITANRKWHYLMNPQYNNAGGSIDAPCFTLIAKMDKRPPYLVATESGAVAIEVYTTDSPCTRKIKEFMAMYGIVDIKMRMLKVPELLRIQGFPDGYMLAGSQADQKKFIGNSVQPYVVMAWTSAMHLKLSNAAERVA